MNERKKVDTHWFQDEQCSEYLKTSWDEEYYFNSSVQHFPFNKSWNMKIQGIGDWRLQLSMKTETHVSENSTHAYYYNAKTSVKSNILFPINLEI